MTIRTLRVPRITERWVDGQGRLLRDKYDLILTLIERTGGQTEDRIATIETRVDAIEQPPPATGPDDPGGGISMTPNETV